MTLAAGVRIGPYEIKSPLGEGGMGVVFRARDTQLERDVALKLLPGPFANDPERLARFQREAQLLAALNHPNIAQIYGLEGTGASRCIVMELVEGETLQERLARGPMPLDEVLPAAKQIAGALEAAHEKGITHRDLKPANIKITGGGDVKVLDFGLAKVREAGAPASLSNSPTLLTGSAPGVVMGTVAYMPPEQAKGKEVDRTADVWAFGCVLYEMLTGRAAFEGETVGEILGGIFKSEPGLGALPRETPEGVRRLLRRCLRKDHKHRLQHMGDARIEIEEAQGEPQSEGHAVRGASPRRERVAWTAVAFVTLIAVVASLLALRPVPPAAETRLDVSTPPAADPVSLAISPDGRKIVFAANLEGAKLWLRSLDSASAQALPGTGGARFPFWSPDSRSVGFFADGKLKRIDIESGSVQTLTNAASGRGGAWNRDGVILYQPVGSTSPLFRISASGGQPAEQTRLESQQTNHRQPQFLPDGRHFLYYANSVVPDKRGVYVGEINGPTAQRLFDADAAAVYANTGQLLFVRQETLLAQNFDPVRLELIGSPYRVADKVAVDPTARAAALSASAAGPIAYRAGTTSGAHQFQWFDRSGRALERVGAPDSATVRNAVLSPDGRRVAMERFAEGNNSDIWLLDLSRGVRSRFTLEPSSETNPVWSRNGSRILYNSTRNGEFDLYQKPSGGGTEETLFETDFSKNPVDISFDGRLLLYRTVDPKTTGSDMWALPLDGNRKPFPVLQSRFDDGKGQFSPDGKWLAYESNESGRSEIYLQSFPTPGSKQQVSANGGAQLLWRRDGKELFYLAPDGRLMAVPVRLGAQTAEIGAAAALFVTDLPGEVSSDRHQFMVSNDGQRFLMNTAVDGGGASPITVILNWKPQQ